MIESERLTLRKLTAKDKQVISVFLQDPEVMAAWEHGFSDREVQKWLDTNLRRYREKGCGFLLVSRRDTGEAIGVAGPVWNEINGTERWEIGYIFNKRFWGKGYAREAARASAEYAFRVLQTDCIAIQMRVNNLASIRVAEALGAERIETYGRRYRGTDMPHYIYELNREQFVSRET